MGEMLEIFREPFMQTALLGSLITACICAYLGVFIILKRVVFVGIVLSQAAALGLALGLFIGVDPLLGAFILTLLGVLLFWVPFTEKNISRETLLGFTYAFCASLAIILIAKNPLATAKGFDLIAGNILFITGRDLIILGVVSLFIIAVHAIFFKEFVFISFDRETALTTGLKANRLDLLLYMTIGIVISLSMRISGVIFVFASLIIPAMIGLILARRLGMIFFISSTAAAMCVVIGLSLSYLWDLPSSLTVVGVYSALFLGLYGLLFLFSFLWRLGKT